MWDEEKTKYESEIERLTAELERMLREMEVVMDSKLSLELEIAAYRKLLEVEENRYAAVNNGCLFFYQSCIVGAKFES